MRYLFFSTLILLTICGVIFSQNQTADWDFLQFREIQEKGMRNPQTTPLSPKDFANFKGLNYFVFESKYRIKAIFTKTAETKSFLMPTSTGSSRNYLKVGDLSFKLAEKDFSLIVFSANATDIFVPFKDLTNGHETYSAGRYVYARLPKEGNEVILDFNISHNPNCAYNSTFSCTLPPKENFLQIEINAGEKKFVRE